MPERLTEERMCELEAACIPAPPEIVRGAFDEIRALRAERDEARALLRRLVEWWESKGLSQLHWLAKGDALCDEAWKEVER